MTYTLTLLMLFLNNIVPVLRFLAQSFGIYVVWVLIHYICAHGYVQLCTPPGWYGFIISIALTPSPYCYALRWVIFHGGNCIATMWVILGVSMLKYLPLVRE